MVNDKPTAPPTKSEVTRARILDAALRLFDKQGYDETTMRDIAAEAGLATGAAYYYFRSKPELIMAFYEETCGRIARELPARLARLRSLKSRIQAVLDMWLELFTPHREFLVVLFRSTVDPRNPLSPFAPETRDIRRTAISWFEQALEGASSSIPKDLRPHMPKLLWLYQMGIILFWLHDNSSRQKRTRTLLDGTLDLIAMGIQMANLPLMGRVRRKIITIADAAGMDKL